MVHLYKPTHFNNKTHKKELKFTTKILSIKENKTKTKKKLND